MRVCSVCAPKLLLTCIRPTGTGADCIMICGRLQLRHIMLRFLRIRERGERSILLPLSGFPRDGHHTPHFIAFYPGFNSRSCEQRPPAHHGHMTLLGALARGSIPSHRGNTFLHIGDPHPRLSPQQRRGCVLRVGDNGLRAPEVYSDSSNRLFISSLYKNDFGSRNLAWIQADWRRQCDSET